MQYEPKLKSLRKHVVPEWFHDAKLGIFIHWGLFSVPAYAPVGKGDINEILQRDGMEEMLKNDPYAEWYQNSLRIPGSPVQAYHEQKYGKNFPYDGFVAEFNESSAKWQPDDWAELFKKAGARYVVLVTKHHDGFTLWPSVHKHPIKPEYHATRDIPAELEKVVRAQGLRMGFYYSSLLDWSFTEAPIRDFIDLMSLSPVDKTYIDYMEGHWYELIDRLSPEILWSDIGYPPGGHLYALFAHYYNTVSEGLVDDRWIRVPVAARKFLRSKLGRRIVMAIARREIKKGGGVAGGPRPRHYDYVTPEYASFSEIKKTKWETTRGIGKSFGYNQVESEADYISVPGLVRMFVDIVSKNGNLLLNVGPMADGTIPPIQRDRLLGLGRWLDINGDAIYGTRPWVQAETTTTAYTPVRFTQKGESLYAILLDTPQGDTFTLPRIRAMGASTRVQLLGSDAPLKWVQEGNGLKVTLAQSLPESPAHAFRISPVPDRVI